MKNFRWILAALFSLLGVTVAHAQALSLCAKKEDPATCYLNLANAELKRISDHNERAEALAELLYAHAKLARANPTLVEQAIAVLRSKRELDVENRLELLLYLYEYSKVFNYSTSDRYRRVLAETIGFFGASNKLKTKLDVALWACNFFEKDQEVWEEFSGIFLRFCRADLFEAKDGDDAEALGLKNIGNAVVGVAYEDADALNTAYRSIEIFVGELEKLASSDKKAAIEVSANARQLRAFLYFLKATEALHEGKYTSVNSEIAAAHRLYQSVDFTKQNNLDEIVTFRNLLADFYSQWGEFSKAMSVLSDIKGAVEGNMGSAKAIKRLTLVQYLSASAVNGFYQNMEKNGYGEQVWTQQSMRRAEVSYLEGSRLLAKARNQDDVSLGLSFLTKAANRGHTIALHNLGVIFRDASYGVKQDFQRAFRMFSISAQLGFAGAQNNLGDLFENGFGTEKSYGDAVYWYSQAAQQGEPTAYLSLGTIFAKGHGVKKDPLKATYWLTLASMHLEGENNRKEALTLLKEQLGSISDKDKKRIQFQAQKFRPYRQERRLLSDAGPKD